MQLRIPEDIGRIIGTVACVRNRSFLPIFHLPRHIKDICAVPVTEIHFHEVGTMDALADITAVCFLLEQLGAEKIIASPVQVGFGKTRCAHGLLPVPAPATAELLLGVPIRAGNIEGELCTPTGAALIRQFVSDFGPMPLMTVERMGYGLGQKDFPAANCLRAMLGQG